MTGSFWPDLALGIAAALLLAWLALVLALLVARPRGLDLHISMMTVPVRRARSGIQLRDDNVPGILQSVGYHDNGDPSPSPNSATRSGARRCRDRRRRHLPPLPCKPAQPHDPAGPRRPIWVSRMNCDGLTASARSNVDARAHVSTSNSISATSSGCN
jgi:hypothetical protein